MTHTSIIYSKISEEAFLFHKQILNTAEENAEIKTLYKGVSAAV